MAAANSSAAAIAPPAPLPSPRPVGVYGTPSLYVGDLDPSVNEPQLFELFSQIGGLVSVRICKDQTRGVSLGYAYVNYHTVQEANQALDSLNFTPLNGKPIRVMFSHRDPSIRKSGHANLFIKNLHPSIGNKELLDTFSRFGTVLSCKVATDNNGQTKGYGYVQFENQEASQNAMQLNGMLLNGGQVQIGYFIRRQDRDRVNGFLKFTNVYVKNLCKSVTDDELIEKFSCCGNITKAVVMKDELGNSKGFGFVNFEMPDDAVAAVQKFNGETFKDKVLYVGRAQKKTERVAELKAKYQQEKNGRYENLKAANLYLKNLDDTVNDEKLNEIFAPFGVICSAKVMLDPQGRSKGYGFVQFSSPEDANSALNAMNGHLLGNKPLYVAVAQRKEERMARLKTRFAQLGPQWAMTPAIAPIHGYQPGPPRLAPQQMYGQGASGFFRPPTSNYGFQQQFIPGIRPGVALNYMMPYHMQRQGQPAQRMVVRQRLPHQMQNPQMIYPNGNLGVGYQQHVSVRMGSAVVPQSGMQVASMGAAPSSSIPIQAVVPQSGMQVASMGEAPSSSIPIQAVASALACATPDHQKMILGEQLYPMVELIEPELAGKITGMLLEMEQNEVLHLLESPDILQKKVGEAKEVVQDAAAQLGSLSLNS